MRKRRDVRDPEEEMRLESLASGGDPLAITIIEADRGRLPVECGDRENDDRTN